MPTSNRVSVSTAERFGRWVGRGWRGYVRRERRVAGWLATQGLSASVATALVWLVKLAVLGVLLYAAFWLALLVVFAVAAAWVAGQGHAPEEDEWPFMDGEEIRKSPGYDPNLYNDASHEMFEDD